MTGFGMEVVWWLARLVLITTGLTLYGLGIVVGANERRSDDGVLGMIIGGSMAITGGLLI